MVIHIMIIAILLQRARSQETVHDTWMYAARWGGPNALPDMKQLLYDDVVEINEEDKQTKETAIQIAASAGQVEILRWLLDKGANINSNSGGGSTPLIHGIRRRNTPIILALLKDKDIDTLIPHKVSGRTALHYSVAGRPDMKIARLLIQHDRKICAIKDKKGRTPIELYKSNDWTLNELQRLDSECNNSDNDKKSVGEEEVHPFEGQGRDTERWGDDLNDAAEITVEEILPSEVQQETTTMQVLPVPVEYATEIEEMEW
jgi:hypothetical protein